jgi:hypothetical protein
MLDLDRAQKEEAEEDFIGRLDPLFEASKISQHFTGGILKMFGTE